MNLRHELVRQRRETRALHKLMLRLTRAVYTHTRTDIAPDAALPEMRRILNAIRNRKP